MRMIIWVRHWWRHWWTKWGPRILRLSEGRWWYHGAAKFRHVCKRMEIAVIFRTRTWWSNGLVRGLVPGISDRVVTVRALWCCWRSAKVNLLSCLGNFLYSLLLSFINSLEELRSNDLRNLNFDLFALVGDRNGRWLIKGAHLLESCSHLHLRLKFIPFFLNAKVWFRARCVEDFLILIFVVGFCGIFLDEDDGVSTFGRDYPVARNEWKLGGFSILVANTVLRGWGLWFEVLQYLVEVRIGRFRHWKTVDGMNVECLDDLFIKITWLVLCGVEVISDLVPVKALWI